ncbi:MAG: hypothetical protein HQL50_07735 [Magnetococcales bacterium]|nr:hypothetical protein [Magnetococcales bacterium]
MNAQANGRAMSAEPHHNRPAVDLIQVVQRLIVALESETLNPFELNGFKRAAARMRLEEPDLAFCILGIVAGIERRIDDMNRDFRNAMRHAPSSWEIRYIYANTLLLLGFYSCSAEVARDTCHCYPCYSSLLNSLIQACYRAGRMAEASRWIEHWEEKREGEFHSLTQNVMRLKAFYRDNDLDDDRVERLQDTAATLAHESGAFPREIRMSLVHEGAQDHLLCEMILRDDISPERMADMERTLRQRIQQDETIADLTDRVVFGYTLCLTS